MRFIHFWPLQEVTYSAPVNMVRPLQDIGVAVLEWGWLFDLPRFLAMWILYYCIFGLWWYFTMHNWILINTPDKDSKSKCCKMVRAIPDYMEMAVIKETGDSTRDPPGSLLHIDGMRSRIKNIIFLPMNIPWARIGCWVGTRIYNWSDTWLLASKNLFLIKNNNVCYTCYDRANSGPFSVHQIIVC